MFSDFDTGNDYEDDDDQPLHVGASVEQLQQTALSMFGRFLTRISGEKIPRDVPIATARFLPENEVENILREHGQEMEDGFMISGATLEEMRANCNALMGALLKRILSNVLAEGVSGGLLECEFNVDTNEFDFGVTEKGKQLYDANKN